MNRPSPSIIAALTSEPREPREKADMGIPITPRRRLVPTRLGKWCVGVLIGLVALWSLGFVGHSDYEVAKQMASENREEGGLP